jgi:alkylation response protein AidB-like acyl-CoA dehydrogenase
MGIGTHVVEMSEAEREAAVQAARDLAPEFDRVGKDADEKNEFPFEMVPLYKDAKLPGMGIPKKYGGGGGDILTMARISYELAKGDPAIALAFNMHQVMIGIMKGLMPEELREVWLTRMAKDQLLMCGTFSEERAGFTGLADTIATPVDGGFKITGKKNWATLSEAADITTFNATIVNEDGSMPDNHQERMARERVFIADKNRPGISIVRTWDTHGMRATGTQTLVFDEAEIPAAAEVGDMRMGLVSEFEWAALLFGGVYLGLAVKAFEAARDTLVKKSVGATAMAADTAVRDVGWVQHGLGEMKAQCEIADRVLEQTANILIEHRDATEWNPLERPALIDIVKVSCTGAAKNVTNNAMRLVGGATFRRGHILERLYRDARSGLFQPLTTDACYEHLGKFELGLIEMPGAPAEAADEPVAAGVA